MSFLKLVHPPFSNQEAVWAKKDPEFINVLKQSHFYMIGARPEARFKNIEFSKQDHITKFDFQVGDGNLNPVVLDQRLLPGTASLLFKMDLCSLPGLKQPFGKELSYWFEAGEQLIRFWDGPIGEETSDLLEWFTTEKLLWNRSYRMPGISGLDNHQDLATYDLLYVGIATEQDSYQRLISHGHHARQEILSNEPQRYPGARVTDEIFLFLFTLDTLVVNQFAPDHDFSKEAFDGSFDRMPIVRDAEKAFVSLLKPNYNLQLFPSYPKGADGLYGSEYGKYGYAIGENICFNTAHRQIRGGWDSIRDMPSNDADFIFVDGDTVTFHSPAVHD